jgi:hypothetical protein
MCIFLMYYNLYGNITKDKMDRDTGMNKTYKRFGP